MKKLFIILSTGLLTFSLAAQTDQGDTRFGVVGGLNMAYPVGNDMEDVIDDFDDQIDYMDDQSGVDAEGGIKPRIGMHLGFVFDYFLADNIALSSGFIYSQKGFVQKLEVDQDAYTSTTFYYTGNSWDNWYPSYGYGYYITSNSGKIEQKIRLATELNYFDIPIGIKYATDEGFELSGGLILSILASDDVKGEIDYDGSGNNSYYEDYFDDIDDYEDAWGDDPEETLTGFHIGVGYTFNEKFNISFKLQKTGNFGEIDDDNDNQNLTFQLSTGLYF